VLSQSVLYVTDGLKPRKYLYYQVTLNIYSMDHLHVLV
jgi:hypothetical protein